MIDLLPAISCLRGPRAALDKYSSQYWPTKSETGMEPGPSLSHHKRSFNLFIWMSLSRILKESLIPSYQGIFGQSQPTYGWQIHATLPGEADETLDAAEGADRERNSSLAAIIPPHHLAFSPFPRCCLPTIDRLYSVCVWELLGTCSDIRGDFLAAHFNTAHTHFF